jgi:TatD DNase family protein
MLVDSHCHLDFPELSAELDEVVGRARRAGVRLMITIGTKLTEFERVRAIAERYDDIYCSVGIHPHEAGAEPEADAERLARLAEHPKVVAVGETGLDYFYDHSPREAQARSFHAHVGAARLTGLPVIVHTRDADQHTGEILAEEMAKGPYTGLIHCFTSGQELAEKAVGLGLYISLSGIVTFKKAEALQATASWVPAERLLVETDAPYLAPIPMRGRRNEPAFVVHTAAKVAELRGVPASELAATTTANVRRLFRKIPDTAFEQT